MLILKAMAETIKMGHTSWFIFFPSIIRRDIIPLGHLLGLSQAKRCPGRPGTNSVVLDGSGSAAEVEEGCIGSFIDSSGAARAEAANMKARV
jgi:hypothetical protein